MGFLLTAVIQGLAFSGLALGIYLSLRIFKVPDITTDGSYALGGVITALLLAAGWNPLIVLPLCMTGGWLAGWSTGYIHTKLGVHPLLSGILVMTALYSVNLLILGRPNLPLSEERTIFYQLNFLSEPRNTGILILAFIIILIAALAYILKSDFGIAMRATGDSDSMARAQGVDTGRMKRSGLALANSLTAVSGYLIVQYQGFADINMGIGIVISGLAAVMIGESLPLGRVYLLKSLIVVCVGSVVFRLLLAAALAAGIDPAYLKLITALLVLIIVAFNSKSKQARN